MNGEQSGSFKEVALYRLCFWTITALNQLSDLEGVTLPLWMLASLSMN